MTVSGAVALLILTVSLLPAGIVPTTFAAEVEGDFATATLEMPDGTTAQQTHAVAQELEAAGHRVIEGLSEGRDPDAPPLLSGVTVTVGQRPRVEGGGLNPEPTLNPEANIATIEFKLLGAQQRRITTGEVVQAWREEVGVLPHVRGITFSGEILSGKDLSRTALPLPAGERTRFQRSQPSPTSTATSRAPPRIPLSAVASRTPSSRATTTNSASCAVSPHSSAASITRSDGTDTTRGPSTAAASSHMAPA